MWVKLVWNCTVTTMAIYSVPCNPCDFQWHVAAMCVTTNLPSGVLATLILSFSPWAARQRSTCSLICTPGQSRFSHPWAVYSMPPRRKTSCVVTRLDSCARLKISVGLLPSLTRHQHSRTPLRLTRRSSARSGRLWRRSRSACAMTARPPTLRMWCTHRLTGSSTSHKQCAASSCLMTGQQHAVCLSGQRRQEHMPDTRPRSTLLLLLSIHWLGQDCARDLHS